MEFLSDRDIRYVIKLKLNLTTKNYSIYDDRE